MKPSHALVCLLALGCAGMPVRAQDTGGNETQTRTLRFAKGSTSASVKGVLQGRRGIDYKLAARAGQTMRVTLQSPSASVAFNVLPPGSNDVALPGAIGQRGWSDALPADGNYTIRTYLVRAAARRNERAAFALTVAIDRRASDASARASQGRFDATGKIPCAQQPGQPTGSCDFGVARAGGGTATVAVTRPDGRSRMIYFDKGTPTGTDLSRADGSTIFRATRHSDLHLIQAGDERYEVPDAVVNGG